jgi:nucleotide-binding universal stress UspA family protein
VVVPIPVNRTAVVVGFDGSEDSRGALEWAAAECELRTSPLIVVHADRWAPAAMAQPAFHEEEGIEEHILDEGVTLVRNGHPAVSVSGRRVPPPADESLVAAAEGASLLVVGSRGLGHVQQMVLGSVSRYCVEHARCPVVVLRADR